MIVRRTRESQQSPKYNRRAYGRNLLAGLQQSRNETLDVTENYVARTEAAGEPRLDLAWNCDAKQHSVGAQAAKDDVPVVNFTQFELLERRRRLGEKCREIAAFFGVKNANVHVE
jgi:hypothetical protein